jgi:prevent-host-death family protein
VATKTKASAPSVADFAENVHEYMARLRERDMPMLLSVDGKPAVVVVDARLYEFLARTSQRELHELLEARIKDIDRGAVEMIPAEEAFRRLRRRLAKRKPRKA